MEPIWLGLTAPKLISAATAVGRKAAEPFTEVLAAARGLLRDEPQSSATPAPLSPADNPHSQLLAEVLTGQALGGEGSLPIDDIRTHAESFQDELQRRIQSLLTRAGIELDESVQLRVSPLDGQLEVEGDVPQRAMIEAALASDASIATDFRQLSAMKSLLWAANKNTAFAEAYSHDPYQAVVDHSELFGLGQVATLQYTSTAAVLRFDFR
jgi:hypothetical protein